MQTCSINDASAFTCSCVSLRFCGLCAGGVPAVCVRCGFGKIVAVRFVMTVLMKTKELQSKKSFPLWPRSDFRTLPEADQHAILDAILCSSTRRLVQEKHLCHKESAGLRFFVELLVYLYSLLRLSSANLETILCSIQCRRHPVPSAMPVALLSCRQKGNV